MSYADMGDHIMFQPEIMELSGRIDSFSALTIEEDARLCIQSGAREMILDCSNVSYITGVGMQSLLKIAKDMRTAHGTLAIRNLQPQVREVFDFCGLDSMIHIFEAPFGEHVISAA
jgi:anti-anti-sigma factor